MTQRPFFIALGICWLIASSGLVAAADDVDLLKGTWVAESFRRDGEMIFSPMKLTFEADRLLIVGNYEGERADEASYSIDPSQLPKRMEYAISNSIPTRGIYELDGDRLKLCFAHGNSPGGLPTEFSAPSGSLYLLMVLDRQKP